MAKNRTSLLVVMVVSLGLALSVPQAAHAYLDPASGSMILQAVIGGVAAGALAFKFYWRRIQAFFGYGSTDEPESE